MIKAQQTRFHASIQFLLLGWFEGERLRDGERGWFLAECVEPITCQATIQRNMQRMDRLQGLETNVWIGWAVFWRHGRLLEPSSAQLLRRPFVMPVTQKNEFSNRVSDLPSGNRGTSVGPGLLPESLQGDEYWDFCADQTVARQQLP